jgi:putative transposase
MRYRRADVAGGTYFFTVNLADRRRDLLVEHVDVLRAAVREVKERHPFHIDAFVVLPDHLHAIWSLSQGDADYATRWMLIKPVGWGEERIPTRWWHGRQCWGSQAHPNLRFNRLQRSVNVCVTGGRMWRAERISSR